MKILSLSYFLLYNTINSIIYLINKSICLDNKINYKTILFEKKLNINYK